jgi:hypothetical protein
MPARLAAFSDLVGIVVVRDRPRGLWRRVRNEWRRSRFRLLDVLAFRIVYRLRWAKHDRRWIAERVAAELSAFSTPAGVVVHETFDPNAPESRRFLESLAPDFMVAACKTILRPEIFNVPGHGTFVVHPGICPEYRNAHGCFWALSRRDLNRVGATLLRIDEGVDTGPVYGYYRPAYDELHESHVVIQLRSVYDDFDRVADDIQRACRGEAKPIDVTGRRSAAWGQPRFTDYLRWRRAAHRDAAAA